MKAGTIISWLVFLLLALLCGELPAQEKELTQEEMETFAQDMIDHLYLGHPEFFARTFNRDLLFDNAIGDFKVDEELKKSFRKGAESTFDKMGAEICGQLQVTGTYTLLKIHTVNGAPHLLFRLIGDSGAFNYHDLLIQRSAKGGIEVADIYIFAMGELYSKTIRRGFLPMLLLNDPELAKNSAGAEKEFIDHLDEITEFTKLRDAGKYADAIALYQQWPEVLRNDKSTLMNYIITCMQSEKHENEYGKALGTFHTLFPKDRAADMLGIDFYTLRSEWDKAVECLHRVDESVGGDPYLLVLEGNLLLMQDKPEGAKELAHKAIEKEKFLPQAHMLLLEVAVQQQDHKETLRLLLFLEEELGIVFGDPADNESYAEFIKTDEYKQWKEIHKDDELFDALIAALDKKDFAETARLLTVLEEEYGYNFGNLTEAPEFSEFVKSDEYTQWLKTRKTGK